MNKMKGFNEEGYTYLIAGGNTFTIKEKLKADGAVFNQLLKWHSKTPIMDLPEGYVNIKMYIDNVYTYDENLQEYVEKENAESIVKAAIYEVVGEPKGEYFPGEPGFRIYNLTAAFTSSFTFLSLYGLCNGYNFISGDYRFCWLTQKELEFVEGEVVDLTGTIKSKYVRDNKKTTLLTRCIIKSIVKE